MSIASLEQVKGMLRSMFGVADKGIARAQAAADKAQEEAVKAQEIADGKMDANNPVGTGSFSMGRKENSVVGSMSHTEGGMNVASGMYSHAEGTDTTASAYCSHAEGGDTIASGSNSHAEGQWTIARGTRSHAEGFYTIAAAANQHVTGRYNVEEKVDSPTNQGKYAVIVGNGVSVNNRSNAHTLDWDGNAWYAGTVEGTALILTSPNGTRYQITVDDTGALTAAAL